MGYELKNLEIEVARKERDVVGIDLRAIRNRFTTRIRCVAVAACPEVTPYRREVDCGR